MDKNITIALTSCGRIHLLRKTIKSLNTSCQINNYDKIISEDSLDVNHIKRIKKESIDGFLKGWKILYTGGKGKTNQEKHYNALVNLYSNIKTKYVFHCEDDWLFVQKNYDFIKESYFLLENNNKIGLVQLENTSKSGSLNSIHYTRKERYNQLYSNKIITLNKINYKVFNYEGTNIDGHFGFSLRPGLRRLIEIKKVIFGGDEEYVNEGLMAKRFRDLGLIGVCNLDSIGIHLGTPIKSTKFKFKNLKDIINGFYLYRIKAILYERTLKKLYKKIFSGKTKY